jgi:hypothetical protein
MIQPIPGQGRRREQVLDAYRDRASLLPSERALLALVERRSEQRGFCYAGQAHLAEELRVTERHVRRLWASLRTKGFLAITHRKGQTSILRVIKTPEATVESLPVPRTLPRTSMSGGSGHPCPPRSGHGCPTKNKYPFKVGGSDGPGQATLPFDGRKTFFNPMRPRGPGDDHSPAGRLARGFREGSFLFTDFDGRQRTVAGVQHSPSVITLWLCDEADDRLPPQRVAFPSADLGKRIFWR